MRSTTRLACDLLGYLALRTASKSSATMLEACGLCLEYKGAAVEIALELVKRGCSRGRDSEARETPRYPEKDSLPGDKYTTDLSRVTLKLDVEIDLT
jgi:hypothetical protein